MLALQGVGVLVTRPEQQAMPLCRLLEMQGASTLRLPAVEIKPIGNRRETAAQLVDECVAAVETILTDGVSKAMTKFNRRVQPPDAEM